MDEKKRKSSKEIIKRQTANTIYAIYNDNRIFFKLLNNLVKNVIEILT